MTTPVWVLLGFAFWTLLTLVASVGVFRMGRILSGGEIAEFSDGVVKGPRFHKRAMRAHANCVENLPVYGAIVLVMVVAGVKSPLLDVLALVFLGARVVHTLIHLSVEQTNKVVAVRFSFFLVQVICMFWMVGYIGLEAL